MRDGRAGDGRTRFRRPWLAALVAAMLLIGAAASRPVTQGGTSAHAEQYAVIAHPTCPVTDLSLADLRKMFRGETQQWPNGAPVVLFLQASGGGARSVVLRELFQMDEATFRGRSIARMFGDATVGGPKLLSSDALIRQFTASVPGAVAVVPMSEVDGTVHVLRVDGRLPGSEGYALTGSAP